jgi:hypothetical protein
MATREKIWVRDGVGESERQYFPDGVKSFAAPVQLFAGHGFRFPVFLLVSLGI